MKENPLSEIYSKKVLLNEEKSDVVKSPKELDKIESSAKASPVTGQGPDKVKKDLDEPEENKKYSDGPNAKTVKENMDKETETKKAYEGSFERLFKATLNEELADDMAADFSAEVPTTDDEMVDELQDDQDEVSDLVADLQNVLSSVQSILDKISGETAPEDESEFSDNEMEDADDESIADEVEDENADEEPFKESTELKPLGNKGKDLMGKSNKVGGHPKVHGGKAKGGDLECDPKLKPAKSHDKSLQSPKGKPEVKSTVKRGDYFK
jgi:hypothetical protein